MCVLSIFAQLPRQLVGSSDLLRAGRSGFRKLVGDIFGPIYTRREVCPAIRYDGYQVSLLEVKRPGRGADNSPLIVPGSRIRPLPLPPLCSCWAIFVKIICILRTCVITTGQLFLHRGSNARWKLCVPRSEQELLSFVAEYRYCDVLDGY